MRPIKFRGKRLDNGEWIYGSHLADDENHVIANVQFCVFFSGQTAGETYYRFNGREVDPETVGQFTGLKDDYGVGIYEPRQSILYHGIQTLL